MAISGLTLKSDSQAEHCGVHYFEFYADENVVKEVCRRIRQALNYHMSVSLDDNDKFVYYLGIMPDRVDAFMADIPRRFRIKSSNPILVKKGIEIGDTYGIFFPSFGTYIIVSQERGVDDFTGYPEDVEWLD